VPVAARPRASGAGSRAIAAAALASASLVHGADNPAEVLELSQVRIIGTTPLPGSGVPLRRLPGNVQVLTGEDLRRQPGQTLTGFLDANATGVGLNAAQGNAHQADLQFRGFTASPLLGTPQGVSVFLDGVRINEPFGDVVNWDLIPRAAIASIQLIPGSNPAFGLNTLGGALAIYTKSGASEYPGQPGGKLRLSGGSYGRAAAELETGGAHGPWDWFMVAHRSRDRGWALHNASRVAQLFAKVGWQDEVTDIDLSFSGANTRLEGVQTIPLSFEDPRQPYTYPDSNRNRVGFVTVKASHALGPALLVSGTAYLRRLRNRNQSSNVNDGVLPGAPDNAINDASTIAQTGEGLGLQIVSSETLAGRGNQLSAGVSVDRGRARFTRSQQPAMFGADRGTVPLGPFEPDTDSDSTTRHLGAFVSDSLQLDDRWTLTLAGRLNRADVGIADRSGTAPELNGSHRFSRFNPALGLNFNPTSALTAYAGYNEGMRAPTAIELTCADPQAPCKLPNSFLADPPLRKVVSRTVEAGLRGRADEQTSWSVAVFRTELFDDLQFVSSGAGALNAGYFQNVGRTRRQGLEAAISTSGRSTTWSVGYSWLDARYRTGFTENSPNNSTAAADGTIAVRPGDRLPGLPQHTVKLRAEWHDATGWAVGAAARASSAFHARGDENNRDAAGRVPGHAVLELDASLRVGRRLQWFARLDNVFDRRYANFGILGSNVFTGPGASFAAGQARSEPFRGYGAPRTFVLGLEYGFGSP
jgi:outer membrane receptor protein involved in Fe transport